MSDRKIEKIENEKIRCPWCAGSDIYIDYHDNEWGVPCHDDRTLYEFLVLEGAQAGLSWLTILKRREGYRAAFADFVPEAVAAFGEEKVEELMGDARIVRNRAKIASAINNARRFLEVRAACGAFDSYIWSFVGGAPIVNHPRTAGDVPAETDISRAMSRDLKKRGFTFVGPTICYAYMQATGMVNDHYTECWTRSHML